MKNRTIMVLIGACLVMTAVSGCTSGQKQPETELESLVVEDMEVIDETEYDLQETEDLQTEELMLDLSDEAEVSGSLEGQPQRKSGVEDAGEQSGESLTEEPTETPTETLDSASERKSGKSQAEAQSENQKKDKGSKSGVSGRQEETQKQSGDARLEETQKQSENTSEDEPRKQSETQETNLTQKEQQPDSEESETETDSETETVPETLPESETESEAVRESETETETETAAESETETETETSAESETETETETAAESETETESETVFEPAIMLANDRVNVRREPSTDAEALALLSPDSKVLATAVEGEWTAVYYQQEDSSFTTGYIKSEFLDEAGEDVEDALLEEEAERLKMEAQESEKAPEADTEEDTEEDTEASQVSDGEAEPGTETTPEDTETAESAESESDTKADAGSAGTEDSETMLTNDRVNLRKEPTTDAEALALVEPGSQVSATGTFGEWTAVRYQKEDGSYSDGYIKSEFLDKPDDAAADDAQEAQEPEDGDKDALPVEVTLSDGLESQFELAKALVAEAQKVGVIYSKDNKKAKKQLEEYTDLADAYGLELVTMEIETETDIDLAASELVGEVNCVFCLEDSVVDETIQTICAYADEVEIPVFGVNDSQVELGCVAAYAEGTLHWNSEKAGKLGLSVPTFDKGKIEEH